MDTCFHQASIVLKETTIDGHKVSILWPIMRGWFYLSVIITFLLFLVHLLFCEALPPPSLYLGLYSESKTGELREFTRDSYKKQCYSYAAGDNSTEHCRFYGDCCVDPMRVRERLEPGTFSCLKNPAPSGNFLS